MGARRRSGTAAGSLVLAGPAHPERVRFQHRVAGAAGPRCPSQSLAGLSEYGSLANVAGMMRAVSEVRAVVRWLQPQSTAIAVSGVSMGSPVAALVSHLETVDAVAVYTPIFGLNAMIAQHLGRWGPSVRGVSDVLRSEVASRRSICWLSNRRRRRSVASSSVPGTTEWRCESRLFRSTNGGAESCTGTTAATRGTSSPGVCRRRRSGSLPGSMRKAAADCSGDLLGITDRQVDPCLALGLWHAHRRAADGDRAQDVACGIEYRCGKPGC